MPPRQPPRGRTPRKPLPKKRVPRERDELQAPNKWGSLARKGAGRLRDDRPSKAADALAAAGPPERHVDTWQRTDIRDEAEHALARGGSKAKAKPARERVPNPSPDVAAELHKAVGPKTAPRLRQRLGAAS